MFLSFLHFCARCKADTDEGREREIEDGDERPSAAAVWDARWAGPRQEGRGDEYRKRRPSGGKGNRTNTQQLCSSSTGLEVVT